MRQEKSARLLELARLLAASAEGLTLDEMAHALGVGRRTAERMRDAVGLLFPHMEDEADGQSKRFRISGGLDSFLQAPDLNELAELEKAKRSAASRGDTVAEYALNQLGTKIYSALKASAKARLAPDLEALMRAEAIAVQPGPRPVEDPKVLMILRTALISMHQISFVYDGGTRPGARRTLIPYGLIFGEETFLVGRDPTRTDEGRPMMWRLDRISDLAILPLSASPPPEFDLEAFASQSFGVFQETAEEVTLRVLPEAVTIATRYRFHTSQRIEYQADGSMLVHLYAGGLLELAWKLFRWGDGIEIVRPERLKAIMKEALAKASKQTP